MAGKGGATPSTYAPSPTTQKTKSLIFGNDDVDWVRSDGREFHQCRPAFFKTGAVNCASGSAYAEFGNTKVIVSLFGPRESKKAMMYSDIGRLNCDVSYTTFATPVRGQSCLGKNLVIDPILEEESYQDGSLMLTCMPSRYEVTQLTITGEWSTPKVNEVRQIADLFFVVLYQMLFDQRTSDRYF
ncbi:hypothetical protein C1H46_007088 [Malus baccata]|uniref:Exoribonuclease phosphorolytic domain-containing protein n=1 Tax=Malus baccata TaxID=106549 RepID=A0A540N8A6_MALBA|nr:hypothetical protein C1H46_007088 [Malus baccata]